MEKSYNSSDTSESGFSSSSSFCKLSDNDILKELYEMTLKHSDEESNEDNKNTILSAIDNLHLSVPKIDETKVLKTDDENIEKQKVNEKDKKNGKNDNKDSNSNNQLKVENKNSPLSTRINHNQNKDPNLDPFKHHFLPNSNCIQPGIFGFIPYYPMNNGMFIHPNTVIPNNPTQNNQYYYPINYGFPLYTNQNNNVIFTDNTQKKKKKKKSKKVKKSEKEKSNKAIKNDTTNKCKKTKKNEKKDVQTKIINFVDVDIEGLDSENKTSMEGYTINVTELEKNGLLNINKLSSNELKNNLENEMELHSQIVISSSRGGSSKKLEEKTQKMKSSNSIQSGSDEFAFLNAKSKKAVTTTKFKKEINSPNSFNKSLGYVEKSKIFSENKTIKDIPYYINCNKIWEMSLLAHGSRKIQKFLSNNSPSHEDISDIFVQLLSDITTICLNTYSSYVLEKLMDFLDKTQISKLTHCIQDSFTKISIDEVGNRIIQKLIALVSTDEDYEILSYLASNSIETLCKNKFGQFVIQKILDTFIKNDFIFKYVYYNFHNLITDCYGLLVVKKIIEKMKYKSKEFKISYEKNLWCNIELVIDNKYGHYGLIHMIKEWGIESCLFLIHFIPNNINSICFSIYAIKVCKFIIKNITEDNDVVRNFLFRFA